MELHKLWDIALSVNSRLFDLSSATAVISWDLLMKNKLLSENEVTLRKEIRDHELNCWYNETLLAFSELENDNKLLLPQFYPGTSNDAFSNLIKTGSVRPPQFIINLFFADIVK